MRVIYDSQIFDLQRFGGISRYFAELANDLNFLENIDAELLLNYTENKYLNNTGFLNTLSDKKFWGKTRLSLFLKSLNRKKSIKALRKQKFDLFHPTYYNPYFLDYLKEKPFVLTIYDMIHEIYKNKYFNENDIVLKNKKKLALKAKKIIAISENTKKDIVNFFGIKKDKIEVIYLANSLDIKKNKKVILPERFLLFVGGRGGYKNFNTFIKAIASILKSDKNLFLVCVGGIFNQEEKTLFKRSQIENNVLQYSVSDEQLSYIYQKALAFIFPSLYEGFGIPILESFNCECPVLCSNKSSFTEVAQDAAIYFDPESVDEIKNAVKKIVYDEKLRKDLVKKGFKRSKDFSWERMAKKTFDLYKTTF